jgi:hypothetical protein
LDNNHEALIVKKLIQKELLNALVNIGLIDFINTSNIIKKLDEDISKLENLQENDKDMTNMVVKISI